MSDDLVSVEMSHPMCIMRTKDIKHLYDRIEELEAKLAKAMRHVAEYSNDPHLVGWARRNLAELTGGKDATDV